MFAAGIGLLVVLYFLVSGLMGRGAEDAESKAVAAKGETAPEGPQLVRVLLVQEAAHGDRVLVRGRTEAARSVVVRSETAGTVVAAPVAEGAWVRAGQVLCRLDVDARSASLAQARAALQSEQLQLDASKRLAEKGFRSPTQVAQDQAQRDAASAGVRQAEIGLDQLNIRAPFSGVFDNRDAEVGAYLGPGQPCGTVLELNPILLVGAVSETEAGKVAQGAGATATLASGERISGRVRYVSRDADPQTRTYKVEIVAGNPNGRVRSGLSADIAIEAGRGSAHLVPVTALVLDSAGRQGVRYVRGDTVGFAPVRVLEETPDGVWVTGLQGATQVIVVGQSFVSEGEKVRVAAR